MDVRRRNASVVRGYLVALLSELERFCQMVMEFVKVSSELVSTSGGNIALRVNVKDWVIALVGKER